MFGIPTPKTSSDSLATDGLWRFIFTRSLGSVYSLPYNQRSTISIPFYADLTYWTDQNDTDFLLYVSFNQKDATRPLAPQAQAEVPIFVIYAALAIVGLVVAAFFLKRVEKVIDNPAIELGLLAAAGFALLNLFKNVKSAI